MRKLMWLIVIVATGIFLLECGEVSKKEGGPESTAYGEKEEGGGGPAVARVGKKVITLKELQAQIDRVPPFFRAQMETKEGKKQLVDRLIRTELLYQEALKQGLDKDPEYINRIEEGKKMLLANMLQQKIQEAEIKISEEEIAKYYEEHKDSYSTPATAHIYLILAKVPKDATPEQEKEAKAKIEKAYKEIKSGKDFSEVAKEYSEDSFSAKRGGEFPKLRKGSRSEEFDKVVFEQLKPNEISKPFKDNRGWNIVKLVSKTEAGYKTLEEVKEQIERTLQNQKKRESFEKYIEDLKAKYGVVIYEDVLAGPEEEKPKEEAKPEQSEEQKESKGEPAIKKPEGEKPSESENK